MVDFHYADPVRKNPMNDVCATTLFDNFASANTFKGILLSFNQICADLQLDPLDYQNFYTRLKERLNSWKAEKLWALLDERASHKEYRKQKACQGLRVLIIGAGPCGLRLAIECALLGCKVVVLEKRDRFSRNNVLHVWQFVIHDLQSLGAKFFYPRFCAGSIDHISIRQLQCVLLKIALILGVEVHENVAFCELVQPEHGDNMKQLYGWRANVKPDDHFINDYEFDVLFGADGKSNAVPGFNRKELRAKLAIGVTANFINRRTEAEERVQEISGVAYIFNQQFFKDLREASDIDLENIVYYKDDTHYFVMTAKKQSLLKKGVIKQDSDDIGRLLGQQNIDQEALLTYAREAADFATEGALPRLDYALNHYGQPDVALFDFTSLFTAQYSCRYVERLGVRLLIGIVGDSLHEPFWPTGSGCARGFLGVFDAAWMLRQYCGADREVTISEVLAERESAYRLLTQATPENLSKRFQSYTIDPRTRYPRFESSMLPAQVRSLIDTDNPGRIDIMLPIRSPMHGHRHSISDSGNKNRLSVHASHRGGDIENVAPYIRHQQLARWYQLIVAPFRVRVDNLTTSFRSGLALLAVLRRYRPDVMTAAGGDERFLADLKSSLTSTANWNEIRSRAFTAIKDEFGLDPPFSLNDKEAMYEYLFLLKDILVNIAPHPLPVSLPVFWDSPLRNLSSKLENGQDVENSQSVRRFQRTQPSTSIYGQETEVERQERYRRRLKTLQLGEQLFPGGGDGAKSPASLTTASYSRHRPKVVEKLASERLKEVEQMISGRVIEQKREVKAKTPVIKRHKLDKQEIEEMENRLRETGMGVLLNHPIEPTLSSQESKVIAAKTQILKERAKDGFKERNNEKYNEFDKNLNDLGKWLQKPNLSGAVGVKELLDQHEQNVGRISASSSRKSLIPPPVPPKSTSPCLLSPFQPSVAPITPSDADNSKQPLCHFCGQRVYLAEKLNVENLSFHRRCFRCAYCDAPLKLNGYGMERIEYDGYGKHFFCTQHLNISLPEKLMRIRANKEKQQLQASHQKISKTPSAPETIADFRPARNDVTQPLENNDDDQRARSKGTVPMDEVVDTSIAILSKTRDMLSSGIFFSSNTPERAKFEINARRRHDGGELATGDIVQKLSMEDTEGDEDGLFDEEEILRHNAGDDAISSDIADANEMNTDAVGADKEARGRFSSDDEEKICGSNEGLSADEDMESDGLFSDEERALTDLLDKTGGQIPSLNETVNFIQTIKTQRRSASRDDLDIDNVPQCGDGNDQVGDTKDNFEQNIKRQSLALKTCVLHYGEDDAIGKNESVTPKFKTLMSDNVFFKTPLTPEDARQRLLMGLEKTRSEARARARLKSDEELSIAVLSRSGTRCRSSSVQLQALARTKSHETLSPVLFRASMTQKDSDRGLHRKTYSEELSTTPTNKMPFEWSMTSPPESGDQSDATPTLAASESKQRRSFLSTLLSPSKPSSTAKLTSNNTPVASSESSKETSLLSKIGWKYGQNKRRSKGSLSPQQSLSREQSEGPVTETHTRRDTTECVDELHSGGCTPDAVEKTFTNKQDAIGLSTATSFPKRNIQSSQFAPSASTDSLLSCDSNVSDRDVRRVQRAAAKLVREAENKRHRQAGEVQRQLEELEVKWQHVSNAGLEMENQLKNDPKNRDLLRRWLAIVEERTRLSRYEQELFMQVRELELENQHAQLQQLLRDRLNESSKSSKQLQEEQQLLEQMLHVVSQRDALVSNLEKHMAQDFENYDSATITKKIDEALKQKRYDFRNFQAVFSRASGQLPNVSAASPTSPDERRYLPAFDSVI